MSEYTFNQKLGAETVGTAVLLATVVGSGIMGEALANGNDAIALLGNTIPTGAILVVLITMLGPISGAHFNPAVTFTFWLRGEIDTNDSVKYVAGQILGGLIGVWIAHLMFDMSIIQASEKSRVGIGQWSAEIVATFGLVTTILGTLRFKPDAVASAVGLYITAAYWFTASTSFANPAVTIARSFSNTFAGIYFYHMPMFIAAQLIGAAIALAYCKWQFGSSADKS